MLTANTEHCQKLGLNIPDYDFVHHGLDGYSASCTLPNHSARFGDAIEAFPTKKAAKQAAANAAYEWLASNHPISTKARQKVPNSPERAATIETKASPRKQPDSPRSEQVHVAEQVSELCRHLGVKNPEYHVEEVETVPGFFKGVAVFEEGPSLPVSLSARPVALTGIIWSKAVCLNILAKEVLAVLVQAVQTQQGEENVELAPAATVGRADNMLV